MTSQEINKIKTYFEKIYDETNRNITLFLIKKCKNFSDINDILQEVYMEYYQVLLKKGLDYIKDPEAFLMSLCRKKIATYYTFWERIPYKFSLDEKEKYEQDEIFLDLEEDSVEDDFFRKEMIADVRAILEQQPEDIQKIFYLYYTMELKIPEIAKLLGMKIHTVKNKLFRTRKEIREMLEDWG